MPLAQKADQQISEELRRLEIIKRDAKGDLLSLEQEIKDAQITFKKYIDRHFSNLIMQIDGCSIETFDELFKDNIGFEGSVLAVNLQNQFETHTGAVDLVIEKMDISLNREVEHFNRVALKWSKKGVKALSASGINNRTVLAVRNAVRSVGKQVGFKLPLKFKPYGAVKLAKGINGALAALGLALELYEAWNENQKQEEFAKGVGELVENLDQMKNDLITMINSDDFISEYFPNFYLLKENVEGIEKESSQMANMRDLRQSWCKEAEELYSEFKALSTNS